MKSVFLMLCFLAGSFAVHACPACSRQQPRILRGLVHGGGPQGNWDYLIVSAMVVIVLFTLFFSLKWLMRPGERSPVHIKRIILNYE